MIRGTAIARGGPIPLGMARVGDLAGAATGDMVIGTMATGVAAIGGTITIIIMRLLTGIVMADVLPIRAVTGVADVVLPPLLTGRGAAVTLPLCVETMRRERRQATVTATVREDLRHRALPLR